MSIESIGGQIDSGPFGHPDGARADLDEVRRNFVDLGTRRAPDDLTSPASDRSARIIVGKKGVGKTLNLRRFQANADDEDSLYADDIKHDVPATADVIRVCELYPVRLAAEGWKWIWRRAIMRALISHVVCQQELRERVDEPALASLEHEFGHLYGPFRRARGIYTEARTIAANASHREQLGRELRHPDWDHVEALLGEILVDVQPICFYLDSVDESFANAPLYWLQCQQGLCEQVFELYRDERFGSRLRVIVSIRDLVRASLMQGEHAPRYTRARHIRVLDWDHRAIRYFLSEKIARLPRAYLMTDGDGVRGWLGRDEIYNRSRGVTEKLEDYLLRHTRLIPRDVVQLGNELSVAVARAKARRETALSDEAIRGAVGEVAKAFADEQITVCSNHLASDTTPRAAGRRTFSEFYTSELYASGVQEELCDFIRAVGTERFPLSKLDEALDEAGGMILNSHPNPLNVLWQNGLLGYDPPDDEMRQSRFYGVPDAADFQLPRDLQSYVFHPIIGHKVRIRAAGDRPVRGFR